MSWWIIIHEFNEKIMLNNCLHYSENILPILWNACQTKGSNSINRGLLLWTKWTVNCEKKWTINNKSKSRIEENSVKDMRVNVMVIMLCSFSKHSKMLNGSLIVVQALSHVWLYVTPWTAAQQTSLSFTISKRLLKLMSIVRMMPSSHLILCHPLLLLPSIFPSIRVFSVSRLFTPRGQSIGASASTSVFLMNIQGWFPLELTGLLSLLLKNLSKVFCSTTIRKAWFFGSQPPWASNSHIHTWLLENHSFNSMDLCWQSDLSAF